VALSQARILYQNHSGDYPQVILTIPVTCRTFGVIKYCSRQNYIKFNKNCKFKDCRPPSVRIVARYCEDTKFFCASWKWVFRYPDVPYCACIPLESCRNPSVSAEQSHESLFWSSHPDQRAPSQVRLQRNYLEQTESRIVWLPSKQQQWSC
jgi:hypothetical protein